MDTNEVRHLDACIYLTFREEERRHFPADVSATNQVRGHFAGFHTCPVLGTKSPGVKTHLWQQQDPLCYSSCLHMPWPQP